MNTKTICCVAGKSGGHIIPCLTIAQKNNIKDVTTNILFFSANTNIDKTILSHNNIITWHIMLPLSSRATSYIKLAWSTFASFILSFFYLLKHKPEQIITTGGIVAIPTCVAGFILRIPITVYSLDAVPGKAIQALTPLATSIITPFATSIQYFPAQKCSIAPYPIKYQTIAQNIDQQTAQRELGLISSVALAKEDKSKKTILILGGSQGSLFLNQCMKQLIHNPSFNKEAIQIIHQTGSLDDINWQDFYASKNITAHVFSYYPDLSLMYIAADLIICRAGAGTLFEIKFFNKQCIIIPLITTTTTHQVYNAQAMAQEYPQLFYAIAQNDIENKIVSLYDVISNRLF
jgi:UDP-N-acetylglucosamine--N-acetylmuramyl-(pentapeptide) pyrophosphoryl-undecaprenol N-acetylglucosamine transferase